MAHFQKLAIFLIFILLAIFVYKKKSHPYIQGNPLLLIDHVTDESIDHPGLRPLRRKERFYPLQGVWQLIENRREKSSIWAIDAPGVMRTGTRIRLLYQGKPVPQGDVFQKDIALPAWNIFNSKIWLVHEATQPPDPEHYVLDQSAATTKEVIQTISRKLTSSDLLCLTESGTAQRDVFFINLPEEGKTDHRFMKIKVRRNGSPVKTRYAPGIFNDFYQTEGMISLHPDAGREKILSLPEQQNWKKSLKLWQGKWVLHFVARTTEQKTAPLLQIALNHDLLTSLSVANQEWKSFYVAFDAKQKRNELALNISGETKRAITAGEIQIQEISLWPSGNQVDTEPDSAVRWEQTELWNSLVYQPPTETVLNVSNPRPLVLKSRYFLAGPVSILVTARTDREKLNLGIYQGRRRLGSLTIAGTDDKRYELRTFSSGGWSSLKLLPEPIDPTQAGEILIKEVRIHHPHGILFSLPNATDSHPEITVQYRIDVPVGPDSVRSIIAKNILDESLQGFLTSKKQLDRDTRHAFLLQPEIKVRFPVQLPENSVLKFSFAAENSNCSADNTQAELIVRSQPVWGLHKTLLRKKMTPSEKWLEQEISLENFSTGKTVLTFEARNLEGSSCSNNVWIANPIIASKKILKHPKTVIFFSADALRADHMGSYGYARNTTPNLDHFSKESVHFTNAVSQAPWTLPSFASLLTSLYPSFHGAFYRDSKLESRFTLLPEILKKQKFVTAGFVQNGFLSPYRGFLQGFDSYHAANATTTSEQRLNLVFRWLEQNRDHDLFLLVHFLEPHSPYEAPEEFVRKFADNTRRERDTSIDQLIQLNESGDVVTQKEKEELIALYDAEIAYLDSIFAKFRRKLEELDLYDSSILVFLSDHGEEFQDHGKFMHTARLYQELVRVPLIIKFPSSIGMAGKQILSPVALVDVMPTVLNYLNVTPDTSLQGRSLLPLIRGGEAPPRILITERNDVRKLGILEGSYKYIYSAHRQEEEIYDLKNDPYEKQNLAGSRKDLLERFQQRKQEFFTNLANYNKNRATTEGDNSVEISKEDEESLRALGYVQ